jgi:hypothetical protein
MRTINRLSLLGISLPVTLALTMGCGGGDSPTGTGTGGGSTSSAAGTTGSGGSGGAGGSGATGTGGSVPTPGDGAGIQGCVAKFLDADGLCHPTLDKCSKGTIPKFDEGCVPVGIPGCSDKFLEADGICHVAMSKCPSGTFAVPTEGCVPIDGAAGCGAAPWGAIADVAGTIWVDPTYAGGNADGSKAKPLATLTDAFALAPEAGRVALAAGDYPEYLTIKKSIEIVGRCPSLVKITGAKSPGPDGVTFGIGGTPAGVTLRNLQIGGPGAAILIDGTVPAKVTIDGVWVNNAQGVALLAGGVGAVVDVKHSLFQGTHALPDGKLGEGIDATAGAHMTIEASAVVDNLLQGISSVGAGTKITFTNGLIEGTSAQKSDGFYGFGAIANLGAIEISGSALVANQSAGATAYYGATSLSVTDSVIEKTKPDASADTAIGVYAQLGAPVDVKRTAILTSRAGGVIASGKGAKATIDQSFIADTTSQTGSFAGDGIELDTGASVQVTNTTIARNRGAGIAAFGKGTLLDAKSCLIEATTLDGSLAAPGVLVQTSATVTLDSCALVANTGAGIMALASTSATLTQSLVADTLTNTKGNNGGSVFATGAKSIVISASVLLDSKTFGVFSDGPLTMNGSVVRGVKAGKLVIVSNGVPLPGVADGALLVQGKQSPVAATIVTSLFESCERAGILFNDHLGSIKGSTATKNRFGLVIQGTPIPDVGADNSFVGNTETDKVDAGMLPVP